MRPPRWLLDDEMMVSELETDHHSELTVHTIRRHLLPGDRELLDATLRGLPLELQAVWLSRLVAGGLKLEMRPKVSSEEVH
jgi:hypothetical protein